jgi:hypothetical protein
VRSTRGLWVWISCLPLTVLSLRIKLLMYPNMPSWDPLLQAQYRTWDVCLVREQGQRDCEVCRDTWG